MSNQPYPPKKKSNAWACAGIGCGGCAVTMLLIMGLLIWPFIRHSDIYDAFMDGFKGGTTVRHVMVYWDLAKFKHPYSSSAQLLVVQVRVTNLGYERVPVHVSDFSLSIGGVPCTPSLAPVNHPLLSSNLSDGEASEGCIAFEVPAKTLSQAKAELTFKPIVLGRNFEVICKRAEKDGGK